MLPKLSFRLSFFRSRFRRSRMAMRDRRRHRAVFGAFRDPGSGACAKKDVCLALGADALTATGPADGCAGEMARDRPGGEPDRLRRRASRRRQRASPPTCSSKIPPASGRHMRFIGGPVAGFCRCSGSGRACRRRATTSIPTSARPSNIRIHPLFRGHSFVAVEAGTAKSVLGSAEYRVFAYAR